MIHFPIDAFNINYLRTRIRYPGEIIHWPLHFGHLDGLLAISFTLKTKSQFPHLGGCTRSSFDSCLIDFEI